MKQIILGISLLIGLNLSAGELSYDGYYSGKNLYVINPFGDASNTSFCITSVLVNGSAIKNEINSSSFEIDFSLMDLKSGDKVAVKISYKDGCTPKVINAEVLKPTACFAMVSIKADNNNLKWITRGEMGSLTFVVEEFRWNNWRKIAEVPGLGTPDKAAYEVPINSHSGTNKYRVSQTDYTRKTKYSKVAQFQAPMTAPEVTFAMAEKGTKIKFSAQTVYQIWDNSGKFIKEGTEAVVDISDLEKGAYHLYYDDKTADFNKK
jgi:hypothetical protein